MKKNTLQKTFLLIVVASTILSSSFNIYRAQASEITREELSYELEKIKGEQSRYLYDITSLQNQSQGLFIDLDQSKAMIVRNKEEIKEGEERVEKIKEEIESKKESRNKLTRTLYINGSFEKTLYLLLLSENVGQFIEQEIHLRKIQQKLREELIEINRSKDGLEKELESLAERREDLHRQIESLENQMAQVGQMLSASREAYQELERSRQAVEKQILDLTIKTETENKRDFIEWDIVDFSLSDSLTIYGAGTPHGLGMSQYGAKAMADSGKNYKEILTHYYQGTKVQQADTTNVSVRVLLSASSSGGNIQVRSGTAELVKENGEKEILGSGSTISARAGIKLIPQTSDAIFQIDYKSNKFKTYRGSIEIITNPSGGIMTINSIHIEDYLKGVVPGEVSASWNIEALKSQAIAARNYAYKNRKGGSSYDLCDTPSCQVYLGSSYEFDSTNRAIDQTRGELLFYGNEIITAYYFSSSGGWTENNENVWGGTPLPYLRGVPSPNEASPYNSWKTNAIGKSTLESYLNSNSKTAVGKIEKIEILKRGVSGRVMAVRLTGSSGEKIVTGAAFKTAINLGLPDGTTNYIRDILFGIR